MRRESLRRPPRHLPRRWQRRPELRGGDVDKAPSLAARVARAARLIVARDDGRKIDQADTKNRQIFQVRQVHLDPEADRMGH